MNRNPIQSYAVPAMLLLGLAMASAPAQARPHRVNQIPHGAINRCANCHVNPSGGGPRNVFGTQIELGFLDVISAAGNVQWQASLAGLDDDGDGATNGQELQDPGGIWRVPQPAPGNPALVTNPGIPQPRAVPGAGPAALLLAALGLGGLTAIARRRRR